MDLLCLGLDDFFPLLHLRVKFRIALLLDFGDQFGILFVQLLVISHEAIDLDKVPRTRFEVLDPLLSVLFLVHLQDPNLLLQELEVSYDRGELFLAVVGWVFVNCLNHLQLLVLLLRVL